MEISPDKPHPRSYRPDLPLLCHKNPKYGTDEMRSGKEHVFEITKEHAGH